MILKPCPFCQKDIPRSITVCPYCHRDEQGKSVVMDSSAVEINVSDREFQADLKELASEDSYARDIAVARVAQRGAGVVQALITVLGDFAKPNLSGVARVLGKSATVARSVYSRRRPNSAMMICACRRMGARSVQ